MVFSSITFLYYFLPLTILLYFLLPEKFRNGLLLIMSLFFYFYGEPRYIFVLILSCIINYYFGKFLEKKSGTQRKYLLILNLLLNFSVLFYFKYFNFFLDNVNVILGTNFSWTSIIMPIGISFFTFQASSYIIDIYRGDVKSAKNIFQFATYLSLFPQLIAGPIVRYQTIEEEIKSRKINYQEFYQGIKRFIIGLSKKVLFANVLGELSKSMMSLSSSTFLSSWLEVIANSFQIYYDFSSYSDMAIGLGLMFGFHFLENFNYPFISKSISEFWRRWHISLSTWFKDYVYTPLGGSKVKPLRRYINIFIVWMVTGLWHGASWNFVLWGLYFAIFLMIEKSFLLKYLEKNKFVAHLYTIIFILISFIFFFETNLNELIMMLKNVFGLNSLPFSNIETIYYLKNYLGVLLLSLIGLTPWVKVVQKKVNQLPKIKKWINILEPIFYFGLLLVTTGYIVDESFNPFLYFRF